MSKGDFLNNGNKSRKNAPTEQNEQTPQEKSYLFFYISLGCLAVGALLFGLAFAIKGAGTYLLIASMVSELASVTFLNAQKRRYVFKWIMVARIASYIVMGAALLVFTFGAAIVNIGK